MSGPAPICAYCVHFHRDAEFLACDAFIGGIPATIIDNQTDHRVPVKGDHGIFFAQDPKRPALDHGFYDRIIEPATKEESTNA